MDRNVVNRKNGSVLTGRDDEDTPGGIGSYKEVKVFTSAAASAVTSRDRGGDARSTTLPRYRICRPPTPPLKSLMACGTLV